jgi:hypothetical protein
MFSSTRYIFLELIKYLNMFTGVNKMLRMFTATHKVFPGSNNMFSGKLKSS